MRIAVLECAGTPPRTRARYGGYGGMFKALLAQPGDGIEWDFLNVVQGPLPAPGAHDGYIVSGSHHAVSEPLPWIVRLQEWLAQRSGERRPLLGCCFGAQLLAVALGGEVVTSPHGWELGARALSLLPAAETDPMLSAAPVPLRVHKSHADIICNLPARVNVLARSERTPVELFRVGDFVMGMQGHPEFDDAIIEELQERLPLDSEARKRIRLGDQIPYAFWRDYLLRFLGHPV